MSTADYINKIVCGDCLEIMQNIEDKSVDLVLTDPPYGEGINKMNFVTSGAIKVGGAYRNDYSNHNTQWDNVKLDDKCFKEIFRISKNQIICGGNFYTKELPISRGWIVWDKRTEDKYANDFADCELIWTSFDIPSRVYRYLWSGMLQQDMKHKEERFHPTQKPVPLGKWILKKYAKPTDLIFDPFAGSGSFLVASKLMGLNYIGCDLSPEYCKIAEQRIAKIPNTKLESFF